MARPVGRAIVAFPFRYDCLAPSYLLNWVEMRRPPGVWRGALADAARVGERTKSPMM
jgi:hypothetical protein